MVHRDALVDARSMMLQQVSEASQRVKLAIRLDRAVTLANRGLDLLVDELDDVLNMRLEIFIVGPDREPTQRDESLTAILGLSVRNVLFYLVDDLHEAAGLLVVARNEAIHGRNQIDALLLDQSRFGLAQHSLDLVNDPLSLVFAILIFTINYLQAGALLTDQLTQNRQR